MKLLRILLTCLVLAIALAALLAAAAFVPAVQTWVAQMALAEKPDLQGSLGSLSAGLAHADITDLHLTIGGAVLTLPSLQAELPLVTAVRDRKVLIRSLVARGWTLDLSRASEPAEAGSPAKAEAGPAQKAARAFAGLLNGWKLPCDLSLDGIDLEGDVLMAVPSGSAPARVHVMIKGGGMAAGREGAFTLDVAVADSGFPVKALGAHGRLAVRMTSPRIVDRIALKADLSTRDSSLPARLVLSADVAAAGGAGEETYAVDLSRGDRHLAVVRARFSAAIQRLAGTWRIDLQESDWTPPARDRAWLAVAAVGDGQFDGDPAFHRIHAVGRLNAKVSRLGVVASALDRLGAATVDTRFDLTRDGPSIRVARLSVALAGARPAAALRALQPFDYDVVTGELKLADPDDDWIACTLHGLPLAWISGLTGRFTFAGGDATGDFVVRAAHGGFSVRSKTPLVASGVSLRNAGNIGRQSADESAGIIGQRLDLSLMLAGDYDSRSWRVQCAPLAISGAGRRLATVTANLSGSATANRGIAIAGTWSADLDAMAKQRAFPGIRGIAGSTASGEFSASVGDLNQGEIKLTVVGHNPSHTVTADVRAQLGAEGGIGFFAPVKIALGSSMAEISVEGTWTGEESGPRTYVKLTSADVALEHLRLLAAPLAIAGGVTATAGGRDRIPFWGDWAGRLTIVFDRLRAEGREFTAVDGTFQFDHRSLRLEDGDAGLPNRGQAELAGTLFFDPAAEFPYRLQATGTVSDADAAPLFAGAPPGRDPTVEGHFSIAGTVTGEGANLEDLIGRMREEFHLTSKGGIVRLLKTSVADAIPQASSTVSDTLGSVGSAVGSFFGVKKDFLDSGNNPVSKTAEAVLDLTYQVAEIGCDQIAVTAIRGPNGAIRLSDIAISAPNERLTGSGRIGAVPGRSIAEQPLSLDLRLGVRGHIAELMATAGLIASAPDSRGYTMLARTIHFGGTLDRIDESEWRDLLGKAATRKTAPVKKGG